MKSHHQSQMMEALEARRLLSAELLPGGELLIIGTSNADTIVVEPGLADGQVALSGVLGVSDGTTFSGVTALTIRALGGPDIVEVLSGIRNAQGGTVNATILGGTGADQLFGGDGDDSINGGRGTDEIHGGDGDDVLKGNTANDTIFGGNGNDRLVGGGGNDRLSGEDGDDRVLGNTQADELFGGAGNDRLLGGNGPDVLHGGAGDDFMEGRAGADDLFGGDGNDLLKGLNGRDNLFGGDGNDELRGNGAADNLHGGAGNDVLLGGVGPDVLFGGLGQNEALGGAGSDNFRVRFSQRQDFQTGDRFFTDAAGQGQDFALIDDEFWDEIERVEAFGIFTDQIWAGIDGAQEILAHCGDEERALEDAIDALSDDEGDAILRRIEPVVISFLFNIGTNFENLTAERILQFFDEMQAADLGSLSGVYGQFVSCLAEHQDALDNFVGAMIDLGELGVLDPVFRDGFFDLILNVF